MIRRLRASLAAAATVTAAVALAACGAASGGGGGVGPVSTAAAPTNGVLKLGFNADPGQPPDPDVYYAGNGLALTTNLYEGLVAYSDGPSAKIVPSLATSWSVNAAHTVFTFHLRHGVTFHDGTPFTAAAVKVDFERRLTVDGGPAYMAKGVKSFAAPDPYTSVITLDAPNSAFLDELASPYGVRMISPAGLAKYAGKDHAQTYLTTHDLGTGPYTLTVAKVDSRYVMKAYPKYWGGKPSVTEVDFTVYTDTSAMQLALNNGALGAVISALPSSALGAYEHQSKLKAYQLPTMQVGVLYMNAHKSFMSTPAARKAMFEAVDWKSVIKEVIPNTSRLATGAYADGALPGGSAPPGISYDPKALSAYVAKLPKGTAVTLGYQVGDDDDQHIDSLIAAQLDALGLKATVAGYQTSVIFGSWFGHPEKAPDLMVSSSTWPDADSPYLYGHVFWDPDGGLNFMGCSSAAATKSLAAGLRTGDNADYVAAAGDIQAAECTPIFAYSSDFVIAQPWLGGVAAAHSSGEPYSLAFDKLTIAS
jgi:peptide/nickel transport system substrate-binding protein